MGRDVPAEQEVSTVKFLPNLSLAKRIGADIGCDDPLEVHRAIQRRCPGMLRMNVRFPELSREMYEDLCFAVESEIARPSTLRLLP
jgi:hypothetical protein